MNERSWIFIDRNLLDGYTYYAVAGNPLDLYANASMSKTVSVTEKWGNMNLYYLEPGTYYLKAGAVNCFSTGFGYIMPVSALITYTQEKLPSGNIKVNFFIPKEERYNARIKAGESKVSEVLDSSWKNEKTITGNSCEINEKGKYSLAFQFLDCEWKYLVFSFILDVNADGISTSDGVSTELIPTKSPTPTLIPVLTPTSAPVSDNIVSPNPSENTSSDDGITDYSDDEDDITTIILKNERMSLTVGEEKKISFHTEPEDTEAEDLEWISSNEDVAEVDGYGRVTAVSAGEAKITVQTEDGEISASLTVVVNPQPASIISVKSSKKKITIKWERVDEIGGYQVSYALKSSFTGAKNKNIAAKNTTVTLKNLKSKKYYFIRIRTFQTVSGKKYYSAWSKISKIKVK